MSAVPDTITFTNTTTYGRIVGTPPKENQNKDEPEMIKYVKGFGVIHSSLSFIECKRTSLLKIHCSRAFK